MNENKINDGGSAFGGKIINQEVKDKLMETRMGHNLSLAEILSLSTESGGMTLRDYFAAKAMEALIIKDRFTIGMGEPSKSEQASNQAYDHADAMIKAREAK